MTGRIPSLRGTKGIARRSLLTGGALAMGLGAAGCAGDDKTKDARAVGRSGAITWRVQTHIGGDTDSFRIFKRFCASVGELSEGRLIFEPYPPNAIAGVFDMFEALKSGLLDCASCPPTYSANKIPELAFLSSYPLGLDRPDQWESWFYELGGLELARKMHVPHNIHFVGPVQHDLNIIHSRIPIRSFEEFRGKRLRLPGGLIGEVFASAGAKTIMTTPDQIYPALANGSIDAADFVGPAVNFELGYATVAKYIILGPPETPCVHQPCDLYCVLSNLDRWRALPKHLQNVVEYAVRRYSWEHYGAIQKANTLSWAKYAEKKVEIIRLSSADVDKFRKVAIPIWFRWAKKSRLGREAFGSQLAFMRSPGVAYLDDADLVDADGNKLTLDG